MRKFAALIAALALMLSVCACALCEISVTRRDLAKTEGLDPNVSHILLILQDGEVTDTLMLASINSKTGRAVMTQVSCRREIELTLGDGSARRVPLCDVYAQGDAKSRGLLVCRELNRLLGLDMSTYVMMDITQLPQLVHAVGALNMELTAQEAAALGKSEGRVALSGEETLAFVRLRLDGDDPARSRSYDALMQLLYQGLNSGNLMDLIGIGIKMLGSMDTNMNPMMALPLATAVQGGGDHREVIVTAQEPEEEIKALVHREIYE